MSDDKDDDNVVEFKPKESPSQHRCSHQSGATPSQNRSIHASPRQNFEEVRDPAYQSALGGLFGHHPLLDKLMNYMGMGLSSQLGWHPMVAFFAFIGLAIALNTFVLSYISGPLIYSIAGIGFFATILSFVWFVFVTYPLTSRLLYHGVLFFRNRRH